MDTIHFATLYDIRHEAGLDKHVQDDRVTGAVDGVNTVFSSRFIPMIDRGDDEFTVADVLAFVDGNAATVSSVEPLTGTVTLSDAPASGSTVLLDYYFGEVPDSEIEKRRKSAESWLARRVAGVYDITAVTADNFPDVWHDVIRLRAGGFLQITDYGANTDTDGSSKDGYKKIKLSEDMLSEWIGDQNSGSGGDANSRGQAPVGVSDGNLYERHKFGTEETPRESEWWNKR